MKALVVGAGLAGAVAARTLHDLGWGVEVTEAADRWGGQLHGATANQISYEPHGAHIFHTYDADVWNLVNRHVGMLPYRHRVLTEVNDRLFSWPPQLSELQQLKEWRQIERELGLRPREPDRTNFETWCLGLMGHTLYEWFVQPYTQKQWGMDPAQLSSHWAPKRIELRTDGYTSLFRDPYQGYPSGGYLRLIDSLLHPLPVSMGVEIRAENLAESANGFDAVVLTAPLDDFFDAALGPLPWRGVRLVNRYLPGVTSLLAAPVVNHPGLDRTYTRRIETKLMTGQEVAGTVVSEEYPGSDARHYPIDDADGQNRKLSVAYLELLAAEFPFPVLAAGRLATYSYINMDQAIRQGLNVAQALSKSFS